MQLIDNLTREQAIELVRVERSTSDFLRSQLAEMREQIESLEKRLAEANHTIELRGAANMQLCEEYEQLQQKLEAVQAGAINGSDAKDAARYQQWRDNMITHNEEFIKAMAQALPSEVGMKRRPTRDEWDAAIDATMKGES